MTIRINNLPAPIALANAHLLPCWQSNDITAKITLQSLATFINATAPVNAGVWGSITGAIGVQADLQTALGLKSPIASPTFTGVPAGPTAAADTSTTQLATTAFVLGQASNSLPLIESGAGAAGTSAKYARADHVHPISGGGGGGGTWGSITGTLSAQTDLNTALGLLSPIASPTFTGVPAAPTAAANTNTTQVATTAYVVGQAAAATPLIEAGAGAVGTSLRYAREDHVHPIQAGSGVAWGAITGTLASQTDLNTALGLKAPLASPTLTGTPAAPTAAGGTNTTQIATTAYVQGEGFAKLAGPTFTGVPAGPTAAVDTNTTQLATTAFVLAQASAVTPLVESGTGAIGTSTRFARADHVHPALGGGGSPGGSTLQLQYNNAGAFAGMSGSSWDDTNRALTMAKGTVTTSNPHTYTETWNAAGVAFKHRVVNVTQTASAAGSMFDEWQAAGVVQANLTKLGQFQSLGVLNQIAFGFTNDANTGVYWRSAGVWGLMVASGEVLRISGTAADALGAIIGASNGGRLGLGAGGTFDTFFGRIGAGSVRVQDGSANPRDLTVRSLLQNVQSVVSNATVTPALGDSMVKVTALAVASQLANPTGTWNEGEGFVARWKDNATARALTFGTKYRGNDSQALPTTTVVGKTLYAGFLYNATDDKFDLTSWYTL